MLSPTNGLLRGLRAAFLGVVGFVLALVAHVAAGGARPGTVVLLALAGLTGLAAVMLTGARLSPVRVVLSLTSMQVLLHEAFMRLATPVGCSMTEVGQRGMPIGHGAQPLVECGTGMAASGVGQSSVFAATTMFGAHAAATAAMAALLAYGEKVLWFLAGWVRPPRWLRLGLPELPPVLVVAFGAPPTLRVRFDCGGVGRRGPPTRDPFAIVRSLWRPIGSAKRGASPA